MSIILGDEVVRNIPEQVADNTEEIAAIKTYLQREVLRREKHLVKITWNDSTTDEYFIYGLTVDEIQAAIDYAEGKEAYDFWIKVFWTYLATLVIYIDRDNQADISICQTVESDRTFYLGLGGESYKQYEDGDSALILSIELVD